MRLPDPERSRLISVVVFALVAAYLLAVRVWGVSDSFLLLRDQVRDWRFALGPFSELPLTGTQSTAGGSSFGPIYYWLLWIIRHVVGPFTGYQPHAGAIGLSILQTLADLFFLYAIRTRFDSLWLAVGTTLLAATAPHDLAIASTIWNPAVSIAFVKIALAAVLLETAAPSTLRTIAVTVAIWFAVQAHTAAIFVAAPLLGAHMLGGSAPTRLGAAVQRLRTIVEVILVLQIPFLYYALAGAGEAAPTRALGGAMEGLRLQASAEALLNSSARILAAPWYALGPVLTMVLVVAAALVTIRGWRDLRLLSITVLPLLVAVLGFSLWQGGYDEYWYLPLAPCVALMLATALTALAPRCTALALLVVVLAIQPWRVPLSRTIYRMPEYGPLSRGSRTIYRQTHVLRRIETTFQMPPFGDEGFIYEAMGGRFRDEADFDAVIDAKGDVQFRRVSR